MLRYTTTVGISRYWYEWLKKIVATRIRKSMTEIVEEGLKGIKYTLDREAIELDDAKAIVQQRIKGEDIDE